jgi:hypothetical protein
LNTNASEAGANQSEKLLTNTHPRAYSKRQVCHWVDIVLVVIAEPLWVKAFRVRVVVGVTLQRIYWDKDVVSRMQFQWRVAF